MKRFKIPYARCTTDNKPVDALNYKEESDLTCYECNDTLYYRKGHEKISKKSGISYQVRAHFYHAHDNNGVRHESSLSRVSSCSGECTEHLLAKEIVTKFTKFRFYHKCMTCLQDYHPLIFTDTQNIKTEYRWHSPIDNTLFVPDVAILDEHDVIKSVIEIHHTHQIPDEKIDAFNSASIAWVEVEARHIIAQFNAKRNEASVQRSSSFTMSRNQCNDCHTRLMEIRIAERNAFILRQEQERLDQAEAEKLRLEEAKRIAIEKAEEREKKAEDARLLKEKARLLQEKKKEEAAINEKKRKLFYDNKREMNAKKAKIDVLTPEQKQSLLDDAFRVHVEREYIERRKNLLAYQDMIMVARKKRRDSIINK